MPANYVLLERIELNASAASVSFTNIPQSGYTDLKVVASLRGDSFQDWGNITINGGGTAVSMRHLLNNSGSVISQAYSPLRLFCVPSNLTASTFSNAELYIPNYANTSYQKSMSVDGTQENNGTATGQHLAAGLWASTSAITTITVTPDGGGNFVAGSSMSLYGLAAVGTTPVIAPKASGGNRIDYDGTYWIHTFTTTGAFVPQTGLTCDYLVVAGGGAGGASNAGGGGGAGGLRSTVGATGGGGSLETALSLSATSYTITVGAGGSSGSNGSNSVFSTITATGGGKGGAGYTNNGSAGGSGGGGSGSSNPYSGGAGTANQGYAGGNNYPGQPSVDPSGGGGGAGAVGVAGGSSKAGNGGAGVTTSISGTSVTYAGGGGGGLSSGTVGTGVNGGGNGSNSGNGSAGTVNTGGGGGGCGAGTGGTGGSGIVIIRYLAA